VTKDPNRDPDLNSSSDPDKGKRPKSGVSTVMTALIVVLAVLLVISMFDDEGAFMAQKEEIDQIRFFQKLYTGQVHSIEQEGELRLTGLFAGPPGEDGEPNKGFTVEFPPKVLADRYDEIQMLVSSDFKEIRADDFLVGLTAKEVEDRIDVRGAYTLQSDAEFLIWVQFIGEDGVPGQIRVPNLAWYEIRNFGSDPNSILRAIEEAKPGLEIAHHQLVGGKDKLKASQPSTMVKQLLFTLAPWLLIIGLFWFFLMRQMRSPGGGGGVLSFGRSRAQLISKEKSSVTFDDVAGIDEAKEEVEEIIEFLKNPARFSRLGGRIPRGVLLIGPPGTGKTLLAKAIAGEADVPFFSISGSDFVEMFVGVGASRVRDLFRQAREHSPCLVFLDEIDAVGRKRGSGLGGGHDEREQTLNAILVEMDGFETDVGIILVAATNRPDVLDPALLRPGRFDRQIMVGLPDLKGREEILRVHTTTVKIAPDIEMTTLARATPGFSGAELAALVNEAALIATLKNREWVELPDFEEARDKVRWGRQKKGRVMEEKDRLVTAYHEAGHALVGFFIDDVEPLHKVTIIPRGMSLGATMVLPTRDRYNETKRQILGYIAFAYGGRVAEELTCDDISTGAYDDIKRATDLARQMVTQWGMSDEIGPIAYSEGSEAVFLGQDLVKSKGHSETMGVEIDREVKRIVLEQHERARKILSENRDSLEAVALGLMQYETLTGAEVAAIVEGKDIDEMRAQEAERERIDRERRRKLAEEQAREQSEDGASRGDVTDFGGAQPEPA